MTGRDAGWPAWMLVAAADNLIRAVLTRRKPIAVISMRLALSVCTATLLSAASGSLSPPAIGDASTLDFGYGVTLTLATGWTIQNQGPHYANLVKGNGSQGGMDVSAGTANTPDINQESARLIGQDIKARGLINVKQQPQVQVQAVQAKNFQQSLPINYTADVQTGHGTFPAYGTWIELFNPSAQRAAFIDFYAISGDAFQASLPEAQSMIASML